MELAKEELAKVELATVELAKVDHSPSKWGRGRGAFKGPSE